MAARVWLLLLALAATAQARPTLEGEWDFQMPRPPRSMPRNCIGTLALAKGDDGWTGTIQFRRILGGRKQELQQLEVRGKGFQARLVGGDFEIDLRGKLGRDALSGRLDWKGYDSFTWEAFRPGLLFEPGRKFDRDLPRGDAGKLGLDPAKLAELVVAARHAYSDAVLVVKDGKLVCERTFGHRPGPIETMSVTKFVTAIAIALLLEGKRIESLEAPLSTWFPEWKEGARGKVTLRHVLTHTSGIRHEKMAWKLNMQDDRVAYARKHRLENPPGTKYAYNNDAVALLGGVVREAAGVQADDLLGKKLFRPLGIRKWNWARDTAGTTVTYAELALEPRDLARIGRFVVDGGRVGSRTLLSPETIALFSQPATKLSTTQGLLWQVLRDGGRPAGKIVGVYHTGWLGQWLVVCPEERLVAVRLRRFEDKSENESRRYEFGTFAQLVRATVR